MKRMLTGEPTLAEAPAGDSAPCAIDANTASVFDAGWPRSATGPTDRSRSCAASGPASIRVRRASARHPRRREHGDAVVPAVGPVDEGPLGCTAISAVDPVVTSAGRVGTLRAGKAARLRVPRERRDRGAPVR